MNRQSISVAQIVIICLVVVTTIVLTAFGAVNYYRERGACLNELRLELRRISGQLSSSLALPMWNLDFEQVGKIIESAMQDRQVYGVIVNRGEQDLIASTRARDKQWHVVPAAGGINGEGLLSDKAAIVYYDKQIGTVQVFVTPRFMEEALRNILVNIAVGILTLNFCLVSILFVVLSRTVLRPLKAVEGYTQSVSEGGAREACIREKGFFGELENLRLSVGKMTECLFEAQEELVRGEKLAVLGRLSGSVGHELRNPLGVMNNAVYFLKMVLADADESVQEYLGIIKHEIENSERIIADLLDFARTKPPQTRAIAAGELIAASVGRCAVPETIRLCSEAPEGLPQLSVDPLQMGQVLQNLITNAVQAMPEGGELNISARLVGAPPCGCPEAGGHGGPPLRDFIEISVADTGEGIAPENMAKLFQPLFTTKARGIGLGLVVCKNLVEANGGRIAVESRVGEGTTFTVTLPVAGGN